MQTFWEREKSENQKEKKEASLINHYHYTRFTQVKHNRLKKWWYDLKATWEAGVPVIAIAGCGQDVVGNNMANGSPSKNINNVETNWIIWFQEANIFLGTLISCLKVSQTILLRHLFCHVLPLEVKEHKPSQKEWYPCAQAYDQWWVKLCFHS